MMPSRGWKARPAKGLSASCLLYWWCMWCSDLQPQDQIWQRIPLGCVHRMLAWVWCPSAPIMSDLHIVAGMGSVMLLAGMTSPELAAQPDTGCTLMRRVDSTKHEAMLSSQCSPGVPHLVQEVE